MRTTLSKSIAILLGVVFLASGASVALAGPSASVAAQQPVAAMDPALSATEQRALAAARDNYTAAVAAMQAATTDAARQAAVLQLQAAATERSRLETAAANQVALANATSNGGRPVLQQDIQGLQTLQDQLQAAIASGDQTRINTATAAYQQSLAIATASADAAATEDDPLLQKLSCHPLNGIGPGDGSIADCIPIAIYYAIYKPFSYLLIIAGKIFDFTLYLSINKSYVYPGGDQGFVASTWTIVRDFSNMLFIFILLYTGIMTIFGSKDWPRAVKQVIIVALLVNFSLFFTKVVIDAGNILAVGIYESMGAAPTGTGPRGLSKSLVSSFEPQRFTSVTGEVNALDAIIIFLIAAGVNLLAAWAFFKVALVFIGRLMAFWFLMIVSPFAFISTALPKGNIFNWWLETLLNQAFVAPVFLFMLYIIMQVVNTPNGILTSMVQASGYGVGNFITDKLIIPVLMAVLLFTALQKAVGLATKMAGEFGAGGAKLGAGVLGLAGGAALGGAAIAGRTAIGGAAQALQKSGRLQNLAVSENYFAKKLGRAGLNLTDRAQTASWDARGNKWIGKASKESGVSLGSVPKTSAGGLVATQERRKQEDLALAQKLKVSEEEKRRIAAQTDPNYTAAKNRVGREQDALVTADEAARTSATGVAFVQAREQNTAAQNNLSQANAVAQGSPEGVALMALDSQLAALVATETQAKADKTAAENAYNTAAAAGTLTTAITNAFTNAVSAESTAINNRTAVETNRNAAQGAFDATHKTTIDTAKAAANAATAAMNAAATTHAGSAEKQAADVAKAQLEATRSIITEAEKAADNIAAQRRAAYAQDVEQRGWTEGVWTEAERNRQRQTAADIRASTPPDKKKDKTEELLQKILEAQKK